MWQRAQWWLLKRTVTSGNTHFSGNGTWHRNVKKDIIRQYTFLKRFYYQKPVLQASYLKVATKICLLNLNVTVPSVCEEDREEKEKKQASLKPCTTKGLGRTCDVSFFLKIIFIHRSHLTCILTYVTFILLNIKLVIFFPKTNINKKLSQTAQQEQKSIYFKVRSLYSITSLPPIRDALRDKNAMCPDQCTKQLRQCHLQYISGTAVREAAPFCAWQTDVPAQTWSLWEMGTNDMCHKGRCSQTEIRETARGFFFTPLLYIICRIWNRCIC
jgi:hypothetical protein